jgi:hypothetical protein
MKKILKNCLYFFVIPFLLGLLVLFILCYVNYNKFNNYKLKPNVTSVFIGDSHVQLSIDDKIIDNSINLSQSGEPYYFTFIKLKNILKNNPSVDKIYLGFSYHNLSSSYDDFIYGKFCSDISAKYFYILPNSEKLKFIKYNSDHLTKYLRNIVKKSFKKAYTSSASNHFKNSCANKKSMEKRISFQFYSNGHLDKYSNNNIYYLSKIINLCKTQKIDLVMLNAPLHLYYKSKIPKQFIKKYNDFIKGNHLKILDLSDFALNDSCYIPDGDHVSKKGSLIISKYIATHYK